MADKYCATEGLKSKDFPALKTTKSDIGPGPKLPAGAPPPKSKGSISYPKQVGKGK